MNYQVVLDLWEANARFDEFEAKDAGVVGTILRLNDMNGGHHLDTNFFSQWLQSRIFDLRFPYFVYNPWVKGNKNAQWFLDNTPTDGPQTMALDVEVKRTDIKYPTNEYANQVFDCCSILMSKNWKVLVYTGYGFLDLMNRWMKNLDYWWARYLFAANPVNAAGNTWTNLMTRAQALSWEPDLMGTSHVSPGPVKLWQISDKWFPRGTYNHAIDVNIWNGSLASLLTWAKVSSTPVPIPLTLEDRVGLLEDRVTILENGA